MSICGIGTDIVSLVRVRGIKEKQRVAEYVLTIDELELFEMSPNQAEHLGSRLAAKESVIKAFPEKLTYQDFSISKRNGKPCVSFQNESYNLSYKVFLSISHEFDNATGLAVCDSI